jgi:uncharacterized membrane protein YhhN
VEKTASDRAARPYNAPVLPFVLLTIASTGALLLAERNDQRAGIWIFKPLAAVGFLGAALANGALGSAYGGWILAGLVLSFAGDVLLIPRDAKAAFLAGLVCFLLGHVAYAGAFALRGLDPIATAIGALPVAAASLLALRYLWPHVQTKAPKLQWPVLAYVAVISTMLVCAAGAAAHVANPWILVGAIAFYVSDLAVARQRFVAREFSNKLWGLPLYFGAQLVLAATVAH